ADGARCAVFGAAAVGSLVKDSASRLRPKALGDVVDGKAAITPALVTRMVKQFHTNEPRFRTTAVETDLGPRLTSREWDVLAGLAEGLSTRDIARRLQLKPSGVRAHISAIVQKLGVENRQAAVDFFRSTTDS